MRRTVVVVVSLLLGIVVAAPTIGQSSIGGTDGSDDKVTGQAYVRHDGGTDAGIEHCSDPASNPAEDDVPDDGDVDSNDGGSRRQANEPFSVVDPTDPGTVVAGWNDYCLTDLGAGWQGFAYSTDSGETWTDSLVPGYPQDTSEEGQDSPLFGDHTDAGDPIAAFDNAGNLFVGGIAFNREGPVNGDVYVATYGTDPVGEYPVDYQRTRIVSKGTPSRNFGGIFQDKPMLEVDRTGNQHDGNVYVCWSRFTGNGQNRIQFSRSTDTGQTFSRPISLTTSGTIGSVQGCDIAVESDGDVYVTYRTFSIGNRDSGLDFNRSTDGGPASARRSSSATSRSTSRPTESATAATDPTFARRSTCSTASRWSRALHPTRAASFLGSISLTTRSGPAVHSRARPPSAPQEPGWWGNRSST
jgi:hypothetical protein